MPLLNHTTTIPLADVLTRKDELAPGGARAGVSFQRWLGAGDRFGTSLKPSECLALTVTGW